MIEFAQAGWLALGLVVLLMVGISIWLARWRRGARARFAGGQASSWRTNSSYLQLLLVLGAGVLIVLAAARPVWGQHSLQREREGVDLVIALDISQSMNATDAQPTRLGLAQGEIARLLDTERGSRVGLVFFAGTAIVRSPLTTDTQAIAQLVRRADQESGLARAGSDIGSALDQAALVLAPSENTGKAVLVVSDGEDFLNRYTDGVAALREKGIVVYTAGVGTAQGSTLTDALPGGQTRPKLDSRGNPVVSHLDETSLKAIAAAGAGRYTHLGAGGSLVSLREDLNALQQSPAAATTEEVAVERFQYFVGAALVMLALAWVLPARIALPLPRRLPRLRPHGSVAMMLLALLIGGCGASVDALREANQAANARYDSGDFQAALDAYQKLLTNRPDVPELAYNTGNTLHQLGNLDRAIQETQRALPPTDPKLGVATYYALGNHLLAADKPEAAYQAYRSALLIDPNDLDSKHNLEIALRIMAQRQQQQQDQAQQQTQQQPGEDSQQQGDQQPQQGQPSDQGQPGQQQQAQQGQPGQQQPSAAEATRALQDALKGIDKSLSPEEAIHILDLLRQQQETQSTGGQRGAPVGPDY